MEIVLCKCTAREHEIELVLVEPGLLHVGVGAGFDGSLGEEVAFHDLEATVVNSFRVGEVRSQKLVWKNEDAITDKRRGYQMKILSRH